MYSKEGKIRAAKLYVRYGPKAAAAMRELGRPGRVQLASWHREWQDGGGDAIGRRVLLQLACDDRKGTPAHVELVVKLLRW